MYQNKLINFIINKQNYCKVNSIYWTIILIQIFIQYIILRLISLVSFCTKTICSVVCNSIFDSNLTELLMTENWGSSTENWIKFLLTKVKLKRKIRYIYLIHNLCLNKITANHRPHHITIHRCKKIYMQVLKRMVMIIHFRVLGFRIRKSTYSLIWLWEKERLISINKFFTKHRVFYDGDIER